ncbi:DUF6479 family protein [Streptomyces sp. NPDC085929]|uniref:DUF6479 family protein n=1 Tax=Streptomyces sp. NPDC085929 TaxID=3365739 RepID=UPI0037D022F3
MTATEILAAEGQGSLFLILAGVAVVCLLIGAFWYGSRRSARRRAPAGRQSRTPWRRAGLEAVRTHGAPG